MIPRWVVALWLMMVISAWSWHAGLVDFNSVSPPMSAINTQAQLAASLEVLCHPRTGLSPTANVASAMLELELLQQFDDDGGLSSVRSLAAAASRSRSKKPVGNKSASRTKSKKASTQKPSAKPTSKVTANSSRSKSLSPITRSRSPTSSRRIASLSAQASVTADPVKNSRSPSRSVASRSESRSPSPSLARSASAIESESPASSPTVIPSASVSVSAQQSQSDPQFSVASSSNSNSPVLIVSSVLGSLVVVALCMLAVALNQRVARNKVLKSGPQVTPTAVVSAAHKHDEVRNDLATSAAGYRARTGSDKSAERLEHVIDAILAGDVDFVRELSDTMADGTHESTTSTTDLAPRDSGTLKGSSNSKANSRKKGTRSREQSTEMKLIRASLQEIMLQQLLQRQAQAPLVMQGVTTPTLRVPRPSKPILLPTPLQRLGSTQSAQCALDRSHESNRANSQRAGSGYSRAGFADSKLTDELGLAWAPHLHDPVTSGRQGEHLILPVSSSTQTRRTSQIRKLSRRDNGRALVRASDMDQLGPVSESAKNVRRKHRRQRLQQMTSHLDKLIHTALGPETAEAVLASISSAPPPHLVVGASVPFSTVRSSTGLNESPDTAEMQASSLRGTKRDNSLPATGSVGGIDSTSWTSSVPSHQPVRTNVPVPVVGVVYYKK